MTIELLYTSAAQGLKQGSRGFCTVISTAGLPINLAQRLESLSGYRHLYQPGDPRADDNPICHSHIRLVVGGKTLSILSRVSAYGVDYSQRTNKIAHHVVFDGPVPSCGPGSVLLEPGIMRASWDGECRTLQSGPSVPSLSLKPSPCNEWQRITGDAGWAGVVANAWLQPAGKPVWIVFSESQSASLLALMQEAIAILPEAKRWQATFSTYCTNLPPDVECRVRCVIAGSDEARMSIARGTVLDLTKSLGMALDCDSVNAARNGNTIGYRREQVLSTSEISHVLEMVGDDSKSPLPVGAEEEGDFRLQNETPNRQPIPIAMPTQRIKKNENSNAANSKGEKNLGWTLAAVAACMLIVLTFVGTGVFVLSNPTTGIVDSAPTQVPEAIAVEETGPISKLPHQTEISSTELSGEAPKIRVDEIAILKLSFRQSIEEIEENEPVMENRLVADIELENGEINSVQLVEGKEYFELKEGKLFLIPNPFGFTFKNQKSLNARIGVAECTKDIKVAVKQIDLSQLKLDLTDSNSVAVKSPVKAGTKLIARVNVINPKKLATLEFKWQGLRSDGSWVVCSTIPEYEASADYLRVNCTISNSPQVAPNSIHLKSDDVSIVRVGTGKLRLEDVVSEHGQPPEINIELPIEVLQPLDGDKKYRAMFAKTNGKVSKSGTSVTLSVPLRSVPQDDKSQIFALPTSLIASGNADLALLTVHKSWVVLAKQKKKLLDAVKGKSQLSESLRKFTYKVDASDFDRLNEFLSESDKISKWFADLNDYEMLRKQFANHQEMEKNDPKLPNYEQLLDDLSKDERSSPEWEKWKKSVWEQKNTPDLVVHLRRLSSFLERFGQNASYKDIFPPPLFVLTENTKKAKEFNLIDNFIRECDGKEIPASFGELSRLAAEFKRATQALSEIDVEIGSKEPVLIQVVDKSSNELNPNVKELLRIPLIFKLEIVNSKMERLYPHVSGSTLPSSTHKQPQAVFPPK